jgi:hypothetical protein
MSSAGNVWAIGLAIVVAADDDSAFCLLSISLGLRNGVTCSHRVDQAIVLIVSRYQMSS